MQPATITTPAGFALSEEITRDYTLLKLLGKGGIGEVYLAEQLHVGRRPVALKVLNRSFAQDPGMLSRFKNEAAIAGALDHENVVKIHDCRITRDGQVYVAMEYVQGESLRDLLKRQGALPFHLVINIARQVCAGLHAAHQLGVVHRDIKPDNIMLVEKEPAFHEEVEAAHRQKQHEHSEYAFFINTRDAQDEQITRTGDKLKIDDTLYDNPLVQDYVNRVGQSIVPQGSTKLYAFKVTLNPIPEARSLSTGTVYISSGLLSWIDNEAQLAYILGHEIAYIEKEHWHQDALVERGLERYNEKQEKKRAVFGGLANIGLSVYSGGMLNAGNLTGATISLMAQMNVPTLTKLFVPNAVISWDKAQEDEADQLGLRYGPAHWS